MGNGQTYRKVFWHSDINESPLQLNAVRITENALPLVAYPSYRYTSLGELRQRVALLQGLW